MLGRPGELGAGHEERDGRIVIDRLGVHRLDEAQFVGDAAVCGSSSLSQAPDWPCWANLKRDGATGKLVCRDVMPVSRWPMRIESGSSVAAQLGQLRLVVEQVHLRRAAGLKQIDHPLGPRPEVRKPGRPPRRRCRASRPSAKSRSSNSDASASDPSPSDGPAEKGPAGGQRRERFGQSVRSRIIPSSPFRPG